MIPSDLNFYFPQAFVLLLLLPVLAWLLVRLYYYRKKWVEELNIARSQFLPRSAKIFWGKTFAALAAVVFTVLAFAQPRGNAHYAAGEKDNKNTIPAHDIFIIMDASASMGVADMRQGQTRLEVGKDIADQVIQKLEGESAALNSLTSELTPLSPLTMDYLFVRFMLRHLQINEGDAAGSNLFAAMEGIKSQIEKMPNARLKTVFLFSDGGDSRLESLRGAEREEAMQSLLGILGDTKDLHLQIFTIGLGTQEGGIVPEVVYQGNTVRSVLDEEPLRRLARRGGGEYFDANRASALEIADELNRVLIQRKAKKETISAESSTEMSYDLFFQIPLACAILLLAFILFWPEHRLSINGLSTRVLTTKSLFKF